MLNKTVDKKKKEIEIIVKYIRTEEGYYDVEKALEYYEENVKKDPSVINKLYEAKHIIVETVGRQGVIGGVRFAGGCKECFKYFLAAEHFKLKCRFCPLFS